MKQIISLLISMMLCGSLSAQIWANPVVKGKKATYNVKLRELANEGEYWAEIQNANGLDTTTRFGDGGLGGACIVLQQVQMIIREALTEEELEELKKDGIKEEEDFQLRIRLDSTATKIAHIRFCWNTNSKMWGNLSPDRLYDIEQALIKGLDLSVLSEEDKEMYGSKADIGYNIYIRSCYLYRMTKEYFEAQKAEPLENLEELRREGYGMIQDIWIIYPEQKKEFRRYRKFERKNRK